jgi:hypothetical protein
VIRFINCIRKRADLTPEQFRHYWTDPRFDAIIQRVVDYTGASGHAKNLTLIVSANDLIRKWRSAGEPYDGVLEYWWSDASRLHSLISTPQCDLLLKAMLDYQREFVDLGGSRAFFTEASE